MLKLEPAGELHLTLSFTPDWTTVDRGAHPGLRRTALRRRHRLTGATGSTEACVAAMRHGSTFTKLTPHGGSHERFFIYDPDSACIQWGHHVDTSDQTIGSFRAALVAACGAATEAAAVHVVRLDSVKEVRIGQESENFRKHAQKYSEHVLRSMSILHGPDYKSIDMIAHTDEEHEIWSKGLAALLEQVATTSAHVGSSCVMLRTPLLYCVAAPHSPRIAP